MQDEVREHKWQESTSLGQLSTSVASGDLLDGSGIPPAVAGKPYDSYDYSGKGLRILNSNVCLEAITSWRPEISFLKNPNCWCLNPHFHDAFPPIFQQVLHGTLDLRHFRKAQTERCSCTGFGDEGVPATNGWWFGGFDWWSVWISREGFHRKLECLASNIKRFPAIGVPPHHPFHGIFHYKPTIGGTPIYGHPHIMKCHKSNGSVHVNLYSSASNFPSLKPSQASGLAGTLVTGGTALAEDPTGGPVSSFRKRWVLRRFLRKKMRFWTDLWPSSMLNLAARLGTLTLFMVIFK